MNQQKISLLQKQLNRIDRRLRAYSEKPLETKAAAKYLNIAVSTLHKLTSEQKIPHYKPNQKQMYFKKKDLRKYAFSNKQKSVEELTKSVTIKKGR